MKTKFQAILWPDHAISKGESRMIRDEYNALYNSHAELVEALKKIVTPIPDVDITKHRDRIAEINGTARAALEKAGVEL